MRKSNKQQITSLVDNRGRQPSKNKINTEVVFAHIEKCNPTVSRYRRENAPNGRYLPSDISITSMYEDFCQENKELKISISIYSRCLKEMNIRFTKLGHEECEKCETFKLHNSQHNEQVNILM